MGWWIALGVLLLLVILPLGADVCFDASGFRVNIAAGPFRIPVPSGKNGEKKDKPKEKTSQATKAKSAPKEKESSAGSWKDFLPVVRIALDFLGELRRKIRINRLDMNLIMAGDDPCDLAVNYGRGWAILGDLLPILESAFVIKKRDIRLQCDFTATETKVTARAVITITLGRILSLAARYGYRVLREMMRINKLRKGGSVK